MATILVIVAELGWGEYVETCLGPEYEVKQVLSLADGIAAVTEKVWDVIILDQDMPDGPGDMQLKTFQAQSGLTPMLVITGTPEEPGPGVLFRRVGREQLQDQAKFRELIHQLLLQKQAVEARLAP